MESPTFLGIEIGGTKIQVVSGGVDGKVLSAHRFPVNKAEGAAGIRKTIEVVIREHYRSTLTAVGIGFGGPVNRFTGQIATSFHIEGWSGFQITEWLKTVVNVPVFIDNDANIAALGEATLGAGADYRNVLYVTIGSGVGGGLVVDGEIYHGAIPGEIEIGHIQMDRSGTTLQDCCSGWAIDEKIRNAIAGDPGGVLANLAGDRISGEAVFLKEALRLNDRAARQIFDDAIDDLAFGFSHAIHVLHPEILIVGGGLSLLGEQLRRGLDERLQQYLMRAFLPGPVIKLSTLKEDAVPVGSLVLARKRMLTL